jgi:LPS-assembly protein
MKRLLLLLALSVFVVSGARAQFGSFSDVPIEITSESTRMEGGLAIAEQNVVIRYGETAIYCDYAQYNPETRDVLLTGNVRIYREGRLFTAERALYNLETKVLNTADFRGEIHPFRFAGDSLSTLGNNAYLVKEGIFTTSDSSKPDYFLRARTVRIYTNDRVIFSNVTLFVGRTPVFWYPYLYQSLSADTSFTFTPGYTNVWGAYLLTQTTFPLTESVSGRVRLDLYAERGVGLGFEARWGAEKRSASPFAKATETRSDLKAREVKAGENWGRFISYYIDDASPGTNKTSLGREPVDSGRYRLSLQDRTYFTEDIYSTININKLSDKRFLQDFEESEFRENPNPDNLVALTKWDENYTAILMARKQLNEDFDGTEKLPELALDIKRQPLFSTALFYDSETSVGNYKRNFAEDSLFPDYESIRADTYHQLSRPGTYFGWLSVNPRVGVRATYYSESGYIQETVTDRVVTDTEIGADGLPVTTTSTVQDIDETLIENGSLFRAAVTAGLEMSFKFSKAFEGVQSRTWGLDGLRHIVQPYTNASFVYTNENPDQILQFDRYNRSTQAPPIDFPQFNAIDGLDNWSIVRLGVRNRLQTRRDNLTLNWFELDTFFDVNIDRPDFGNASVLSDDGTFSNVYNRLRWRPLPWVGFTLNAQLPLLDSGFTEVNSSLGFMVSRNVQLSIGQRYLNGSEQFENSNLTTLGGYFRLNDHWGFSFAERYEFETSTLEGQTYQIHRDLSSWVASLGVNVRDNGGEDEFGVLLTFTLKDLPNVRVPLALDADSLAGGSGRNR